MAAALVFQATDTDAGTLSDNGTYTFTATVSSASGQERLVAIAGIGSLAASVDFDACTIDGQAATRVGSVSRGADGGDTFCAFVTFYRAPGTTGTSINVVATANCPGGSVVAGFCAIWSLNDADTLLASTNSAVNDPSLNTNTASGGTVAAAFLGYDGTPTAVWTGLTERFDSIRVFGTDGFTGASSDIVTGSTPLTISAAITPDITLSAASICVSFNPDAAGDTLQGAQARIFM